MLFEGQILSATIIEHKEEELKLCAKSLNNLQFHINANEIQEGVLPDEDYGSGSEILVRIMKIILDNQNLQIVASCKSCVLLSHKNFLKLNSADRPWFVEEELDFETNVQSTRPEKVAEKPKRFMHRSISHRRFANVTQGQAINYLSKKDIGEFLFRPSSLGEDHLTLTLKFYYEVYVNIDIIEEMKDEKISVGMKLRIGKDTFGSLDEIIEKYIQPVISKVKEVTIHRKFVSKPNLDFVKNYLEEEQRQNSAIIHYRFAIVPEYPQYIVLIVTPKPQNPNI